MHGNRSVRHVGTHLACKHFCGSKTTFTFDWVWEVSRSAAVIDRAEKLPLQAGDSGPPPGCFHRHCRRTPREDVEYDDECAS